VDATLVEIGATPSRIIYRELAADVEVVAIAHAKRRPDYWHGR
jgi:plasmid stabilization system protein ParE